MSPFALFRGLLLLPAIPIFTLICCLAILCGIFILRQSQETIQLYPRLWARSICRLAGVRVTISGAERLDPDTTYIYCANHLSQFDIFSFQGYFPISFRWLAKKELSRIPLLGAAMHHAGTVFVNRTQGRQALKSLDQAAAKINHGTSVLIFPEGTRSADGQLHPFKGGAMLLGIKAGTPLVPMAIKGSYEILPKGAWWPHSGTITITIGEPVTSSAYNSRQKQELAQLIHDRVADLLAPEA